MYGDYPGKIIRIDLPSRRIDIQQLDEDFVKNYIGGSGIGTKFLCNETNEQTVPLSPENYLMFMTGPLDGQGAIDKNGFQKALRLRYQLMGWDPDNGIPSTAELIELGLDWLIDEVK